jgi:hypothetical protein
MLVRPLPWCLTSSDRYAGRSADLDLHISVKTTVLIGEYAFHIDA